MVKTLALLDQAIDHLWSLGFWEAKTSLSFAWLLMAPWKGRNAHVQAAKDFDPTSKPWKNQTNPNPKENQPKNQQKPKETNIKQLKKDQKHQSTGAMEVMISGPWQCHIHAVSFSMGRGGKAG